MNTKFRIGLTITPEVLFGIIAKVFPVEDLHIEQIVETPMPDPAIRFDKRFDLPKPKPKLQRVKRNSHGPNLTAGINKLIMDILEDGPHTAVDMKGVMEATGYSPNSIGSRLQSLEEHGIVKRAGNGKWKLLERKTDAVANAV